MTRQSLRGAREKLRGIMLRVLVTGAICVAATAVSAVIVSAPAEAKSPPDRGTAFEPRALSKPLYGTKPPSKDPSRQQHYVEAHDGVDLYVETWLPAAKDGNRPPGRVATILVMTPYVDAGEEEYAYERPFLIDYFTARGYAVAQHHVRGSGESGGCLEQTGPNQIKDGARVVEYLGRDAPWSNGKVGMYGISYDAETQISTAGLGDPERTKYLKAIVPTSSVGGQYDWNFFDGVNWYTQPLLGNTSYLLGSVMPGNTFAPQHTPERVECQGHIMRESLNFTGDYTEYWREREYRPGAPKTKAATLYVHGLRDFGVQPITLAGWFNRLPEDTPHKGVFGVWGHEFPDSHGFIEPDWERTDWFDMVAAWFDRYLKGLPTAVEKWPDVQVQDNLGQWRAVEEFPTSGGPPGQLALGPGGKLGVTTPEGSTGYREQLHMGPAAPGQQIVFETAPLNEPLHLSGQPILDLWVVLDRPDAHVTAALEVIGRDGEVMRHQRGDSPFNPLLAPDPPMATYGARSLQHLEPMQRGWFEQENAVAPPTDRPLQVNVRFLPTDLVVPSGARLRLTISGSVAYSSYIEQLFDRRTLPSGSATQVTVLHDCKHPSALRFLLPDPRDQLLNVREKDERKEPLTSRPLAAGRQDGAGLATKPVCGEQPAKVSLLRDGTEHGPSRETGAGPAAASGDR
ncbi:MAG: CocE/NonD family hydrolase [Actinomycetota bacterium]|nr:CocE/NonD family hydrolase [Actinomycetota bacterium]